MKITKEKLQKIIQEELQSMQETGEVDEGVGDFFKSLGTGISGVAKTAASGVGGAISAAKEASKKADEETARVKEETKKAADVVKTDADVEVVIKTIYKQVLGALNSLDTLRNKMVSLKMPIKTNTLDMNLIIRQLSSAHTTLLHAGKVPEQLPKGQGPEGFAAGDSRKPAPIRPARAIKEDEQE
jgi:phage-related protein